MMAKLTKRKVDAAEPGTRDRLIWDTEVKGFGLKVTPAGDKIFVFQFRLPGLKYAARMTIGRYKGISKDGKSGDWTADEARAEAEGLRGDVKRGNDPRERKRAEATARKSEKTVTRICELYLEASPNIILKGKGRPKKASSIATDTSNIESHIKPLIGKRRIGSITKRDVQKFQEDVAAGKTARTVKTGPRGRARITGGKGTASRATAVLGAIFTYAVREEYVADNPVRGVELYKPQGREKFLTAAELADLGKTLAEAEAGGFNPTAIAAIRLLIFTGCRKSEILGLRWDDVDFEKKCLFLPDSKTGRKTVPLAAAALEVLATLPHLEDVPYVLPATKGDGHYIGLPKAWAELKKRAKLNDVTLHTFRHSFASIAVAGGDSLYLVGKVLGHTQAKTTEKYAHLEIDPLRAVADRAANTIAAAMKGGDGEVVSLSKREA